MRTDSEGRETLDPYLTAASAIGSSPRYVCPMPIWLSQQEYATLRAACAQMLPSSEGAPGAEEAGVADYIDGFLGAFSFDPPRIWAGGPTSGWRGACGSRVPRGDPSASSTGR
jgi:hypothetical protein